MADLTPQDIQKLARLSRLEVAEGDVDRYRAELGAVLGWMDRLGEMDLAGVEPMTRAGTADGSNQQNRLDADEPGPVLANDVVMGLAPQAMPPFFRVPKVLGEGGGA
ncbi:MAG: Asp-tRNA(Asn)/Glu-tRNA(Gln) amidotransferase subunit GatC [Planctomycetota bacterium]|nr:MAG: Asp-tRNA(Asn)/Glu-tRNA(Gln) amidotransferase subunit GatC [Planctomycetota bacterium]